MNGKNSPPTSDTLRPALRRSATEVPAITRIRLSSGGEVELVNISSSGVLVEGYTKLTPGLGVTVSIDRGNVVDKMTGQIVRCQVAAIAGGALRYQAAIAFDQEFDWNVIADSDSSSESTAQEAGVRPSTQVYNRW